MLQSRAFAFVAAALIFTELEYALQGFAPAPGKQRVDQNAVNITAIEGMIKARLIISPFPASLLHRPAPSQFSQTASLAGELHASRPCLDSLRIMLATSRQALGGRRVHLSHA